MSTLVPKGVRDELWKPLIQLRDYAVLCDPDESVFLRFGQGRGLYVGVDPSSSGRLVNSLEYENGNLNFLGKISVGVKTTLGRSSDANIKVLHAMISRQHLELTLEGNILVVRDLGSTNGTFIHDENKHFDIADYLEKHPLNSTQTETLDWVHDVFGMGIDDFLKTYSQQKKETN